MVVRGHPSLSLTRQCRLLSIGRSSLYDRPKGESAETLALMRRIDALFLKYPFYGARQMVRHLRREGVRIGRRRAARLMRLLGLQAVYRAPRTSAPHLGHRVYPYLLRGLAIERPNHVWCADITYIPVRRGFLYLVAIMDWASRCVLAWRLSNTLDAGFCVEALDEALARHGTPQIFNTDQGSQFTGFAFTARLREAGIRISMDGRGRCMDNIFIERLWRSLKYEAVYLHEIADGFAARRVIGQWIGFYNTERPHSALGGRTPAEAYRGDTPVDMMDKPLRALTTYPQAQQQQQKDRSKRILAAQTSTGIHLENAVSLSDKPTPPHCSYVHTPIRDESFTMMNRGNVGFVGVSILRHWLAMALDVLRISLEQLVHVYPQCLFPVDICRKFGFNPPVGMYFDEYNFVPLATALGKDAIGICQARLRDHEIVDMAMQVYESRPDLTPEKIRDTWQHDDTEISVDAADDSVGRWLQTKSRTRVALMALTYSNRCKVVCPS